MMEVKQWAFQWSKIPLKLTGICVCDTLAMFRQLLVHLLAFSGVSIAHSFAPSRVIDINTRDVTNQSKAGLAWPNGPWVEIDQFRTTGKVSWCVLLEILEALPLTAGQVLHLGYQPRQYRSRVRSYVLGREEHRPMVIDQPNNREAQTSRCTWFQ